MPENNEVRRIILADGTVLDESECGYADKRLWCYLKKLTLNQAFQIFSDPEKTNKIIFEYGYVDSPVQEEYLDFVDLISINKRELTIDVCLEKEVAE